MPTAVAGMRSVLAPLTTSGNPNADTKNGLTLRSHNIFGAQTQSGRNQAAKTVDTGALGRRCTLRLHARWCLTTGRPSEALCRERRNF